MLTGLFENNGVLIHKSTFHSLGQTVNLAHHLSFVHYSVQSICSKLKLLHAAQINFDVLAILTEGLCLESYKKNPENKDRTADSHGVGVCVCVGGGGGGEGDDLRKRGYPLQTQTRP